MLSNKVVGFIAVVLLTAILLDGRAYNRTPDREAIYKLPDLPEINIKKDDELIMSFAHRQGRWHLTAPFVAPVLQSRVEVLLKTNTATTRQYTRNELTSEVLFTDPVTVEIGSQQYLLGQIEPVSQLRYVLANNTVYLQDDDVIPLLHAGQQAFVDLKLTGQVTEVKLNNQPVDDPTAWSDLMALGLIKSDAIHTDPIARVTVQDDNKDYQQLNIHTVDGIAVLTASDQDYGYLLSDEQTQKLQLTNLLLNTE